jgi:patatin-like phospholipase/acyl hydrolase
MRASTAAPTYFPPEVVRLGEKEFIFIDGGITMYNNPAFSGVSYGNRRAFQSQLARR